MAALLLQWLSVIVVTETAGPGKLKKIFTPWLLKLVSPHSIALQREGDELQLLQRRAGGPMLCLQWTYLCQWDVLPSSGANPAPTLLQGLSPDAMSFSGPVWSS